MQVENQSGNNHRRLTAVIRPWVAVLTFSIYLFAIPGLCNLAIGQDANRKAIFNPPPEYPDLARKLKISGMARVKLTITKEGKVKETKELGGNPVLLSALVEAVRKWRYEPSTAETTLEVRFTFQ